VPEARNVFKNLDAPTMDKPPLVFKELTDLMVLVATLNVRFQELAKMEFAYKLEFFFLVFKQKNFLFI